MKKKRENDCILYLSESIDVGSDCVCCTDYIQRASSPTFKIDKNFKSLLKRRK